MIDTDRASMNPLRNMKAPSAKGAPVRNRRPLNVQAFQKLAKYLYNTPCRTPHQIAKWRPIDRLMLYWLAVMTGFRLNELRNVTRSHVLLEHFVPMSNPARITVEGWVAKNGKKATIPIGDDIATALCEYCTHLRPEALLIPMPSDFNVLRWFHRDLDAVGIPRRFDNGDTVDFHTLRSTAICWWLTENKLHLLDVQYRARLRTLALVQEYVDNYAPNHSDLIRNTPRVIDPGLPFKPLY